MYRVDARVFDCGDEIFPQTTYNSKIEDEKLEMEEALNAQRPPMMSERKDYVFLFDSLLCALNFLTRYGGNLYLVEPRGIPYRCDMNKLDNILDVFRFTDEDDELRKIVVNEYWKPNTHTFLPCYEYLVTSAFVTEILLTSDSFEDFKEEFRLCKSIELTPTYRRLLEKVTQA